MIIRENDCCDCATDGYPCIGKSCPLINVPHYYCDDCGDETDLYWYEDEQLCKYCIIKRLEIVK